MDQSQLAQQPRRPLSPSELAAIARWNNWALEAQGERSPGGESEPLLEELVAALDSFYESLEAGVSSSSPPSSPSSTRSSSKLSFHTCAEEADETPIMAPTQPFDAGHNDRVTAVHANFYGTRILTASIDHRIKVWERDPKTGERTLLDTFTAHDADIRDVSLSLFTVVCWSLKLDFNVGIHLKQQIELKLSSSERKMPLVQILPPHIPLIFSSSFEAHFLT